MNEINDFITDFSQILFFGLYVSGRNLVLLLTGNGNACEFERHATKLLNWTKSQVWRYLRESERTNRFD